LNPENPQDVHRYLGIEAVFASAKSKSLLQTVRRLAPLDAAVLIEGESGSGKEVLARALHAESPRASKPWVDLSCAALPEQLVESELFGYEKGAFSGADTRKEGLFELAHTGTLFLDEIGELPARLQAKLLRVLDCGSYYRLGGTRKIQVDVRIVAATNRVCTPFPYATGRTTSCRSRNYSCPISGAP
jgi:transcriptional regulator with PAS, ATPase and Fis domain